MAQIKAEEGPDLWTDIKVMNNINCMAVLPAIFFNGLSNAVYKENRVFRELKFVDLLICVQSN